MAKSKSISAHVAETTVAKIDQLAKLENRFRSQMTGAVAKLGGDLPRETWTALLQIKALSTDADWQALQRDLTRTLLHHRHRLYQRQMQGQVDGGWLAILETKEDILAVAVNLTRHG